MAKWLAVIAACLPAIGCKRTVLVRDQQGMAIEGAAVTTASLSMNVVAKPTDREGRTAAATMGMQKPRWLMVSKSGYLRHQGDFPSRWPATIVLTAGSDPTETDSPFQASGKQGE